MNIFTKYEVENFHLEMIRGVKKQVDELYFKNQIFSLSLETLELTRRFNEQYKHFEAFSSQKTVALNNFLALTRHLERNFIQELK